MFKMIAVSNTVAILFIFLLGLFMPRFTRKEVVFGVRLPEQFREHDDVKQIRKTYTRNYLLIVGLPTAVFIILNLITANHIIATLSIFLLLSLLLGNYYSIHKSLKKIKSDNNWKAGFRETAVMDTGYQPGKALVSPWWFSIPSGLILIQIVIVFLRYDSIPDVMPVHYDAGGNVDRWADKSYRSMLVMPAMEIITILVLFLVYKIIGWSKQELSAENPEKSVDQDRIFRKRWSAFVILLSVIVLLPFFAVHLFSIQFLKIDFSILLTLIIILEPMLLIICGFWIAYTTGDRNSSSKGEKNAESDKKMNKDDDRYWKGGLFYYNPKDPSIFVEQRFGVGWTVNFGNKTAMFSFIGFIILFPALLYLIVYIGHS